MLTAAYTTMALVAFAANSVLCRIALREATVDAATFSTVRLISGAVTLLLVTLWSEKSLSSLTGSWASAGLLAVYAVPFAFAYASLSAGTGALILFGCVQVTMLAAAFRLGERLHVVQGVGVSLALAGFVVLVFPGLTAPPLTAAVLMAIAGISWGVYSVRGRGLSNPLGQTTDNFVRAVPIVAALSLLALPRLHIDARGFALSVGSGAVASGLGYVAWYAALRGLTSMQAATVQLCVPILAALGGVIFLAEALSLRLMWSAILVLGGIALTNVSRERWQAR